MKKRRAEFSLPCLLHTSIFLFTRTIVFCRRFLVGSDCQCYDSQCLGCFGDYIIQGFKDFAGGSIFE